MADERGQRLFRRHRQGNLKVDVKAGEILRRAIPLGLANMSVVLMPLLDSVMLGQHDIYSMASGGLAMQIYLILFMLGKVSCSVSDLSMAATLMPVTTRKWPAASWLFTLC